MLGVRTYSVKSQAEGSFVAGKYVPGAITTSTMRMSIQPMTADNRDRDSSGDRMEGDLLAYSRTALNVSSQQPLRRADRVKFGDFWYEVKAREDWTMGRLAHYRHVLCRMVTDGNS